MSSMINIYTCTKLELWALFHDVTSANQKTLWKVVTTQREKDNIEVVDLGPTFHPSFGMTYWKQDDSVWITLH